MPRVRRRLRVRAEGRPLSLSCPRMARGDGAGARGDWRRVVLLAIQLLKVVPFDREVLQERVEAAQVVKAPAHEVARYVSEVHRVSR